MWRKYISQMEDLCADGLYAGDVDCGYAMRAKGWSAEEA